MMKRTGAVLVLFAAAGCQADRQTFEDGATMETPPAIEQAPAAPFPAQPLPPSGSVSDTTLPPVDPDTLTIDDIRPADPVRTAP